MNRDTTKGEPHEYFVVFFHTLHLEGTALKLTLAFLYNMSQYNEPLTECVLHGQRSEPHGQEKCTATLVVNCTVFFLLPNFVFSTFC